MKKFIAMMMTLAMVLALAVPVTATVINSSANSAGASSAGGYIASYGGATNVPVMDVEVNFVDDATGKLVLNPYNLSVKYATGGSVVPSAAVPQTYTTATTEQVIASPVKIKNKSECSIDAIVSGAVAKSKGGEDDKNFTFATAKIDNKKASKLPGVYLIIFGSDSGTGGDYPTKADTNSVNITAKTQSKAVMVLSAVPANGEKYIRIGGNVASNLDLDATQFWNSNVGVESVSYTLKIRPTNQDGASA